MLDRHHKAIFLFNIQNVTARKKLVFQALIHLLALDEIPTISFSHTFVKSLFHSEIGLPHFIVFTRPE